MDSINGIKIIAYSDRYKQQVGSLIISIQRTEFGVPITLEQQPDLSDIPNFYQSNNGNFWMAMNGDSVVGTTSLLNIGNNKGALRKMFVHADYRGKQFGVGQLLLSTLLQWAMEKQFTQILLGTTEKFLAAQRFYEKNGFTEISKESLPKEFPIMPVDVKFYKYEIHE